MLECMRTEATRKTVTEQRWIPVKYHVMTAEERKAGGFLMTLYIISIARCRMMSRKSLRQTGNMCGLILAS